jgi:hypothetical protein
MNNINLMFSSIGNASIQVKIDIDMFNKNDDKIPKCCDDDVFSNPFKC